ncbi:MurR/RpiR family transcriptional regulator [Paenibacillus sp. 481]|uniref:MurR/RpiR family transcriptional regulator n=1 Tax=Paenibacillus sp. 481 TaxID=2835869 RepID=UPI001E468C8A|nr:MurR/RpiR family transcriptional regulator [Paenibacillus sp. 481]UHA73708.1 MurR/RpiR family transcriptional regulator [Paenibacillus sp. 481]
MKNARLLLQGMLDTLNPAEKRAAQHILEHEQRIGHISVQQLAADTHTSVATVARLAQRAGFSGFRELKLSLLSARVHPEQGAASFEGIHSGMDSTQVIRQLTHWAKQCLEDTALVLCANLVDQAVAALLGAHKTAFFGVGSSSFVAMDASFKWMRLNRWSFAYNDPQVMLLSGVLLEPGDVLVAISYSGETRETLEVASMAKEHGATVISITQVGNNSLHQLADIGLWVTATEAGMKRGDIGSRIAQAHVIDILYMTMISRNFNDAVLQLEETHTMIRQDRRKASQETHAIDRHRSD